MRNSIMFFLKASNNYLIHFFKFLLFKFLLHDGIVNEMKKQQISKF